MQTGLLIWEARGFLSRTVHMFIFAIVSSLVVNADEGVEIEHVHYTIRKAGHFTFRLSIYRFDACFIFNYFNMLQTHSILWPLSDQLRGLSSAFVFYHDEAKTLNQILLCFAICYISLHHQDHCRTSIILMAHPENK